MYVSSVPLLFDCPSSQLDCEHPYDPPRDPSMGGRAVHEALESIPFGRSPDLKAIAERYGTQVSDVAPLVAMGRQAWEEIKDDFPNPMVEHRLASRWLSGRADVFSLASTMAVLDWKTNRARTNVGPQLLGYAECAVSQYGWPEDGKVRVFTVWLRLGEIDCRVVRLDDIERFRDDLDRARLNIGKVYGPGDACTYCRRQLVCRARAEFIRSSVTALQPVGNGAIEMKGLPLLYSRSLMLQRALDRYKDALRMHLRANGPQPDGEGGTLSLEETTREDIKPLEAWPILQTEGFTDEELAGCVTISSGKVGDVVAAKAPKGGKGKAKVAIRELLRDKGAISVKTFEQIKRKKGDTK